MSKSIKKLSDDELDKLHTYYLEKFRKYEIKNYCKDNVYFSKLEQIELEANNRKINLTYVDTNSMMRSINMSKNFKFHPDDFLISITFDDVITAVNCNEEIRDREAVIRVYKEILKEAMINAFSSLTDNMDNVLKELNKE